LAALAGATTALALAALSERQRSRGLEEALVSNRLIGAAVGVLMTRHQMTDDQAVSALRRVSMDANRKLRDLADEVLLTGTVPDVERRHRPQPAAHDWLRRRIVVSSPDQPRGSSVARAARSGPVPGGAVSRWARKSE
jgi:hypothetical protein